MRGAADVVTGDPACYPGRRQSSVGDHVMCHVFLLSFT